MIRAFLAAATGLEDSPARLPSVTDNINAFPPELDPSGSVDITLRAPVRSWGSALSKAPLSSKRQWHGFAMVDPPVLVLARDASLGPQAPAPSGVEECG